MGTRGLNQEGERLTIVDYMVSLISFCERKIDDEYYELLSKAIEYGMRPNEFWNDDIQNFYCYEVAYINKTYNTAYTQGYYNYVALMTSLGSMFIKKGKKAPEYPTTNIYNPLYRKTPQKRNNKVLEGNKGTKTIFHIKELIERKKKGVE